MRPGILIPSFIALAIIWSGVAMVMHVTDPYVISLDKVMAMVDQAPWKGGHKPGAAERKAYIEGLAQAITRLDLAQKTRLMEEERNQIEDLVLDLTESERKWFLNQVMDLRFQPVMKAFKVMTVEDRRRLINTCKTAMHKNGHEAEALDTLTKEDDKAFEKIIERGIGDYYNEGDEKRKLALAPLLQELQVRMMGGRRG